MQVQYLAKLGIHLQNPKQLAIFACCGTRNKTNVPTKFTLQVYVRGIHGSFVSGIHLHFGTCCKISFWNPGTYRHKIVCLSSAQFGLVMLTWKLNYKRFFFHGTSMLNSTNSLCVDPIHEIKTFFPENLFLFYLDGCRF